jgi:hypothetical protein
MDLAVSFQQSEGAQDTWERICLILGKNPDELNSESDHNEEIAIIAPTLENLEKVLDAVSQHEQSYRTLVIKVLGADCLFLQKLGEVFL